MGQVAAGALSLINMFSRTDSTTHNPNEGYIPGVGHDGIALAPAASAPTVRGMRTNFGPQPEPLTPITSLGLNSSMTPEQQRSRIATMALAGSDPAFRGDEANAYYRNLAQRSFTDPSGEVLSGAAPLPVERQYTQHVLGRSFPDDTTAAYLNALLGV